MSKNIQLVVVALGVMALAACGAESPPDAVSETVEVEASAAGEGPAEAAPPAEVAPVESEATAAARVALLEVAQDEDFYSRVQRFAALLPTLGPEAIPVVKEIFVDPMYSYFGATDFDLLVRFWATHQPEETTQWALRKSPPMARTALIYTAFTVWAETDPQAAMELSQSKIAMAGEVRDPVQYALVRGWYKRNPEQLAQFIQQLGIGVSRQRALAAYLQELVRTQGPDAAMEWAEALPDTDGPYKRAVYSQVGSLLPFFDHAATMRWCDAHCDGPYGKNLRNVIARRWVVTDAPAALAWLSTAPEGYDKDLAVQSAYAVWGRTDSAAAVAWMAGTTPETLEAWRRPLLPVYVRLLSFGAPAEAIVWAEAIESDDGRVHWLKTVARVWRKTDEAAAEAWLQQSELSEEAREEVRSDAGPIVP
jgi:hypothetical protein